MTVVSTQMAPLRPCPKCGEKGGLIYCPVCHSPREKTTTKK